ncbi:endonuclease/exonuclease/phosphatase family protein [Thiocapsa bogorovii]|uniref:endonuclease/exonuclease/phosphatase family protein n=1 Tax=Thiocapsa bogorovii TaxID=521689 RepID=UPI001E4B8545|nr:endonuclease/exonuclease/phosphatase family protein [Thiocapsa bogorovii]UHD15307.1 endonuclease/exonuclease/phosphatase family protein [Thiocapsa bogorovii]
MTRAELAGRFRRTPGRRWLPAMLAALCVCAHAAGIAPEDESQPLAAHAIRVLTWNVLAPYPPERLLGLVFETASTTRAWALLRQAKALDPDIVALQEVTAEFMAILAENKDWAGYHVSVEGSEAPPGGLLVLSRYPFAKIAYRKLPSAMGRYALFATLDLGTETLVVANAHLKSLREDQVARKAQIAFVQERLPRRGLTLWLGDFNFGDQEPETARLASWTDAWTRLRPGEPGFSYDPEANPLARGHAFAAESGRRLNRILSTSRLVPIAVGLTGQTNPPSDHYGVWANLVPSP